MGEKIPSQIRRIDLDYATFENTNEYVEEPTFVNFFFGNNGSGKSTIAKAIKSGAGVTYAPGKSPADYLVYLYDEDYINDNFHSYHGMPGVYTLNSENVEAQKQIDAQHVKLSDARKARDTATEEKTKRENARASLQKRFQQECWDSAKALRTEFDKTQDGKRRTKQFSEAVLAAKPLQEEPTESDIKDLRQLYQSAYSSNARQYPLFAKVEDTGILDAVEDLDLLSLAIVNISDTPYAEFIKEIDATQWVREGYASYAGKAKGKCPFCRQKLPDNFEKTLSDSFDEKYEESLKKLRELLAEYKRAANELFIPIQKPPADLYPSINPKSYTEKVDSVRTKINLNIELINKKIADPATPVEYESVAPLLDELMDIIKAHNKVIQANNDIVAAGPRKKQECVNQVFSLIRYQLNSIIKAYQKSDADIQKEIADKTAAIKKHSADMISIQAEIRRLSATTVETESAKDHINHMLRDSGMQGFHLEPHETTPNVYKVVRDDGTIANNLSEGEKNFIAFLYFLQKVFGNEGTTEDTREKIVVIDDPVSSMDSSTLFIVGEQIRKMVEVCRNNADNRDAVMKGNFIKQIFILTHNAYFHREVTYPHADRYEFVSFYLIRKIDNHSTVRLCDKQNPDEPTARINVNPVKNSYAALWEEYKEVSSAVPLMNAIRRILEYYFIQLCGYEGSNLRKTILEDNKDAFTHDEFGNEDNTRYDMASTMLSYIDATSYGVNDGLHYVDDGMDVEMYRETFRMIFDHMHQEQHYNMMMGIKKGGK